MANPADEPLSPDPDPGTGRTRVRGDESDLIRGRGPHPLSPMPLATGDSTLEPNGISGLPMDWENFYKNYRKPGYVPGYEIVNKLGGGVFGAVFKARKESIGKFYAIKFLKVDDEEIKEAVLRELDAVKYFAQLDHPNLVSIEDMGQVDGIPYIVMGYAGAETLKRRLDKGQPTVDAALSIFNQVCHGVNALHDRAIVHFDLKPANIFLKGDFARVGDYGLSRLMSDSRKTLSFGRGTPYYMAPEMLRHKGDRRSDVYSLGVILYECLTGDLPFQGETEWEVLKKHETDTVTFPDSVGPLHRRVISKMLAKDPAERFDRVTDILIALSGAPVNAGVASAPAWTPPAASPASSPSPGPTAPDARAVHPASATPAFASTARPTAAEIAAAMPAHGIDDGGPRPLGPLIRTLRAGRRKVTLALSYPARIDSTMTAGDGIPARAPDPPLPRSTFGAVATSVGLSLEILLLCLLVPSRYLAVGLKTVLELALKLPFRLLAIAWKLLVVAICVGGSVALFVLVVVLLRGMFGFLPI